MYHFSSDFRFELQIMNMLDLLRILKVTFLMHDIRDINRETINKSENINTTVQRYQLRMRR